MDMVDGYVIGYTSDFGHLVVRASQDDTSLHVSIPLTTDLLAIMQELIDAREHDHAPEVVMLKARKDEGAQSPSVTRLGVHEESKLRPAEIQQRLRAGETPEALAKEANTSVEHIMRWFEPVKAEQKQIISIVQHATQVRADQGCSGVPIGQAVSSHLSERGLPLGPEHVVWTANKYEGRDYWTVTVTYDTPGERGGRLARWRCRPHINEIEPLDEHARDIGFIAPVGGPILAMPSRHAHARTAPDEERIPEPTPYEQRYAMGLHEPPKRPVMAGDNVNVVASRQATPGRLRLVPPERGEVVIPLPRDAVQAALQADPDSADPIIPPEYRYASVAGGMGSGMRPGLASPRGTAQAGLARGNAAIQEAPEGTPGEHTPAARPRYVPYQNYTKPLPPAPRRPL